MKKLLFYKQTTFKDTPIGKVPRDWETRSLGEKDIATLIMGQSPPSSTYNQKGVGLPFLQGKAEFGDIYPSPEVFCSKPVKIAEPHDILLSVRAPVGDVNIAPFQCCVGRGLASIRPRHDKLNYLYLFYYLRFSSGRFESMSMGSTFKAIRKEEVVNYIISVPPLREQERIADFLSFADLAIQKTDEVIAKTGRVKNGLMQKLLTEGICHKEFKDTEMGKMPKGWKVEQLGNLREKRWITYHSDGNHGGLYPRDKEFVSQGVPFLSANMIIHGNIDINRAKYLSEGRAKQFQKGVARDGDVLLAHNATVGPVAVLSTKLPYIILGTSLTAYRCDPDYLHNQYLRYYMEGLNFQRQLESKMKQTTRNQVPITAQRKLLFVIPPLMEQLKIAAILQTADNKLDVERKQRANLERIKQGLMVLLLTGKARVRMCS